MRIGTLNICKGAALAPMAGVSDSVFRGLCAEHGSVYTVTEMVSAKGLLYNPEQASELRRRDMKEHLTALQLFGNEPEIMADMADRFGRDFDMIDINMGCPAPKIVKGGAGSALMQTPDIAEALVRAVSSRIRQPVTVKMRLGWDSPDGAEDFAKRLEQAGAAALCVHGRTRFQYYEGHADWERIGKVAAAVSIPVIGNGDVASDDDAERMMDLTGSDVVMIGRAACGNPWIFSMGNGAGDRGVPEIRERIRTAEYHVRKLIELYGEKWAVPYARKHMAWYLKGLRNATRYKRRIFTALTFEDVKAIFEDVLADSSDGRL